MLIFLTPHARKHTAVPLLPLRMSFTEDNVPARRIAQLIGLVIVVVGAATIAAIFTTAPINPLIALASFVPLVLAGMVVGLIVSLVFRRWFLVTASVVVGGVISSVIAPLYVAGGSTDGGETLTIMQSNFQFGKADPAIVVETAREHDADVLTVQELTETLAQSLRDKGLEETFPYQYLIPDETGGGGSGIYSKFPLSDTRELNGYGPTNLVATVGFTTPFTLVAVHPGPAVVTPPDIWTGELATLRDQLAEFAADDAPVVVSGDFNTTYQHKQFRELLAAGYSDAADQLGSGFVPTYPTDKSYPAIIGIDHVLTRGADARSLEKVTIEGADHHGLIVDVSIH